MYVPTHADVPHSSPRARDLGHRLVQQIQQYQQQNPGTTPEDIHVALKIAQSATGTRRPLQLVIAALAAGIALLVGLFAFFMSGSA
jgi:hypothetical protein